MNDDGLWSLLESMPTEIRDRACKAMADELRRARTSLEQLRQIKIRAGRAAATVAQIQRQLRNGEMVATDVVRLADEITLMERLVEDAD